MKLQKVRRRRRKKKPYNNTSHLILPDFHIPILAEKATHLPGVYTEQPTKLTPLAKAISEVLKETGSILIKLGFLDFAAFVLDTLSKSASQRAERLVERLST